MLDYENEETEILVCQCIATFGDGVNDLDGTGGDFELTMVLNSHVNQPDPQLIWFSTATQATVFFEQFVLPIGATVYFKVKSPNAADTTVWVKACIYEVGVESIRDELLAILALINDTIITTPPPSTGTGGAGGGVYASTTGSGTGVIPGHC